MLADRALVSVQAVSALERGYRKVPYPKTLERLADALDLPAEARAALEESARRARGLRLLEHDAALTHNLPRQLTSFLGRDEVVTEVGELLKMAPLVSIVGTGGVGKTRVAIEVARQLVTLFSDGVWFVELAPLNDPELVSHALAAALGVQESARGSLLGALIGYLSHKHLLIVLDNCEHVIDQTRRATGSVMRECSRVAFLTTSREALSITGERVYRLPSLSVPEQKSIGPEEAVKYGAVALFADRVRAADARFTLNAQNVGPIVEICRRLDGLPLGIELAAARATVLSPSQIADRLDRIFDLLTPADAGADPRHRTMQAVIEWSYALLSPQTRLLFDRLAIFASGFSLETATMVCADDRLAGDEVLEPLSSLVAQSLVLVDFSRGDARYHMLEATRQYGLERLVERGDRPMISQRHAISCLRLAQRLDAQWYRADERAWFREAAIELDNCRAALEWSLVERQDVETGGRLAASLARVWYSSAPVEGRNWVRLALSSLRPDAAPCVRAQLRIAESDLCGALGEYADSFAAAEGVLGSSEGLDDLLVMRAKESAGSALGALARWSEAEALLQSALQDARRLDNRRMQALILGDLGTLHSRSGDIDGARTYYAEALTYYTALNLERPAASIAGNLAEIEFAAGDVAAALHRAEEARAGHEAWQNRRSVANDLGNMAAYLIAMDCFDDARGHASEALSAALDIKGTVLTAYVLQHLAAIGALQHCGDASDREIERKRAAMLLGYVSARLASLKAGREYTEQQEYDRIVDGLRNDLGDGLAAIMALGAEWNEAAAVSVALEL
jgi:predicted ATPase